ncbi:hypothetical protein [Paenibacillus cucumis (ex Kampfer et al. 2016)]|uniref:RiboL-PSP-HEPN domain-containing protein n=1 Tax=Paenibacillus cucumis (ex Kampfer et al. 2016) TaxID=1776858 RepID=A0ABS7KE68_9BACL|nr:hypothetical protein [Paenibacillus cucumis (ex Kampfer et al. 2016)]MBY0202447.1 hypothetical protein [Paenibacillus cucumis (ex Kampfer et al. 2016)]
MTDNYEITLKTNFSFNQIQSAVFLARSALEVEKNKNNSNDVVTRIQYESYVTGALLCTVGYLEATINEFFSNIKDVNYNNNKRLQSKKRELINSMWELGVPKTAKYSILEKYQIALTLADKNLFKKGVSPYQDVYLLIQVRNAITHYEPEWVTTESEFPEKITEQALEKKLKNKFGLNPFANSPDPFFPDKCLSYEFIKWGIHSSIKLTEMFFEELDLNYPISWLLNNEIYNLNLE